MGRDPRPHDDGQSSAATPSLACWLWRTPLGVPPGPRRPAGVRAVTMTHPTPRLGTGAPWQRRAGEASPLRLGGPCDPPTSTGAGRTGPVRPAAPLASPFNRRARHLRASPPGIARTTLSPFRSARSTAAGCLLCPSCTGGVEGSRGRDRRPGPLHPPLHRESACSARSRRASPST